MSISTPELRECPTVFRSDLVLRTPCSITTNNMCCKLCEFINNSGTSQIGTLWQLPGLGMQCQSLNLPGLGRIYLQKQLRRRPSWSCLKAARASSTPSPSRTEVEEGDLCMNTRTGISPSGSGRHRACLSLAGTRSSLAGTIAPHPGQTCPGMSSLGQDKSS